MDTAVGILNEPVILTLPVKSCVSPVSLPKLDEPLWKLVVMKVTELEMMYCVAIKLPSIVRLPLYLPLPVTDNVVPSNLKFCSPCNVFATPVAVII